MTDKDKLVREKLGELFEWTDVKGDTGSHLQIQKAFDMAFKAYDGKKMPDGAPLILHHLDIAVIAMKEVNLGPTSAVCALLHSINIKDPQIRKEILKNFDRNVLNIIEGFTKISALQTERVSFQSDTFRNKIGRASCRERV